MDSGDGWAQHCTAAGACVLVYLCLHVHVYTGGGVL